MNAITEYLIKSGIALCVFYLFYWLMMRKSTHFNLNRLTLIFSLVASAILPLAVINLSPGLAKANIPIVAIDLSQVVYQINKPDPGWGVREFVLLAYFIGFVITASRLIYQSIYIHALSKMSDIIVRDKLTIVLTAKDIVPFAYFNKVYISRTKMEESLVASILAHEKSHLIQRHYLDLLLIEIIAVIQWFNPVVWLYERSIKEVHEFLADDSVLKQGSIKKGTYQSLLVNQAIGGPVFTISHQFNQSLIKKRIIMMTKLKSNRIAQLKVLVLLPLTAGLLMAFSNPGPIIRPVADKVTDLTQQITDAGLIPGNAIINGTTGNLTQSKGVITIQGKVVDISTLKPLKGVNIVVKGTTVGTTTGMDGKFSIKAEGPKATLVFSFLGYSSVAKEFEKNTNEVIHLSKGTTSLKKVIIRENNTGGAIDKKKEPYIIIDGKPSDRNTMDALDHERIETVDVLKDEQAIAGYGEKGKDGVILIKTKKDNASTSTVKPGKMSDTKVTGYGNQSDKKVFTAVEQMPEFPGGSQALSKYLIENLNVSPESRKTGLQGTVISTFIVQTDGSVTNAKIVKGIEKGFDEEVLRVIKSMPKWKPGKQNGENVPVQLNLPVNYVLK